jgi:hypothetical protein
MDECRTENRPWLLAEHAATRKVILYQPRCKKWSCPYCAERNKRSWSYKAGYGLENLTDQKQEMYFVTITSRGYVTSGQSLALLKSGWPKLSRRAKYHSAGVYSYMLIPERHRQGQVHCHILTTVNLPARFWKDAGYSCGFGYIADTDRIRGAGEAGNYAGKYLSKQLAGMEWPKGFRRVRTSRNWPKPPKLENDGQWEYLVCRNLGDANWHAAMMRDYGYTVTWLQESLVFGMMSMVGLSSLPDIDS